MNLETIILGICTILFIIASFDDIRTRTIRNRWHIAIVVICGIIALFTSASFLVFVIATIIGLLLGNFLEFIKYWHHGDTKLLMAMGSTISIIGTDYIFTALLYYVVCAAIGSLIFTIIDKSKWGGDFKQYPAAISFALCYIFLFIQFSGLFSLTI